MKKFLLAVATILPMPLYADTFSGLSNCLKDSAFTATGADYLGCNCSSDAHYGARTIYCGCRENSALYQQSSAACVSGQSFSTACMLPYGGGVEYAPGTFCYAFDVYHSEEGLHHGSVCGYCGCEDGDAWYSLNQENNVVKSQPMEYTSATYACIGTATGPAQYGCEAGYYSSKGSGESMTCTLCPSLGTRRGNSEIGNVNVTGCYVPKNTNFTDESGTYHFTSDCYYSN